MEPVILFIAVTAIISGTYIRAKKINLEKERMRLGMGLEPEKKRGFFSRAKSSIPPLIVKDNSSKEVGQLQKRLENLEVIMLDHAESVNTNTAQNEKAILEELRNLSTRIKKLEEK